MPALLKLVQIAGDARHETRAWRRASAWSTRIWRAGSGRKRRPLPRSLLAGAPESAVHAARLRRAFEMVGD